MRKLKKTLILLVILLFLAPMFVSIVCAKESEDEYRKVEYSEDFKKWLQLTDEEKEKTIQPRFFNVLPTNIKSEESNNTFKSLGTSLSTRFSLKDVISSNLSIRNQQQTESCWAFSALSSLETNLALSNYKNGINTSKVYDYSERHMEYATSKYFTNNKENELGYNRRVGSGGQWYIAESYLTNGFGAIEEKDMPFENNENLIDISQIQNKTVASQVFDTVDFPDYSREQGTQKNEIMNQIKQHILNYGSVFGAIHGDMLSNTLDNCYNSDTGAKYCENTISHHANHAVSIIGWDDNYSIDNFAEQARPTSNGAWIVRNSYGERFEISLIEFKEQIFNTYREQLINMGYTSATQVPNEIIERAGFSIDNDIVYQEIGDNGLIYVSYEDCNISKTMYGVEKSSDNVYYDNIYQYDQFYPANGIEALKPKTLICNVFDKKTTGTEYLTQVSLIVPETYTCKVYVNPNGASKSKNDMNLVHLREGETETLNPGYHTLEFASPVEIKGNQYAVAIEIEGTRSDGVTVSLESKVNGIDIFDSVQVENGKCFIASSNDFDTAEWLDLGSISQQYSILEDGDSTIKAFTVSDINNVPTQDIPNNSVNTKTYQGNEDKTRAHGSLPYTGIDLLIMISIISIVAFVGIAFYKKYRNYKDI